MSGKLIVIYGGNNSGKTTQAKLLVDWLKKEGKKAAYLKYPIYDSSTGKRINGILREGKEKNISETEFQELCYENKKEYEPHLKRMLKEGIIVVAEDYVATSLAWGSAKGADYAYLEKLNADLIKEDVALLLDGARFSEAKEKGHIHEENDELMEKVRERHRQIGKEKGWTFINANRKKEDVFNDVFAAVKKIV